MLKEIFFAFWFFLPVGAATLFAFFSGKMSSLKKFSYPIDFHKTFRGKRILGSHKTFRGFMIGVLFAIITAYAQMFLYANIAFLRQILPFSYDALDPFVFGALCGIGSLVGDAAKSFFKRQKGIKPGASWVPFDQIDQIIGGIVFTFFYIQLNIIQYVFTIIVWFLVHPAFSLAGFLLRLKRRPL